METSGDGLLSRWLTSAEPLRERESTNECVVDIIFVLPTPLVPPVNWSVAIPALCNTAQAPTQLKDVHLLVSYWGGDEGNEWLICTKWAHTNSKGAAWPDCYNVWGKYEIERANSETVKPTNYNEQFKCILMTNEESPIDCREGGNWSTEAASLAVRQFGGLHRTHTANRRISHTHKYTVQCAPKSCAQVKQ